MKKPKLKILLALTLTAIVVTVTGCITKNPDYKPELPSSAATNPEFVPDTNAVARFQSGIQMARNVNQETAPVNPYAPLIDGALAAAIAVAGFASKGYASIRSQLAAHKAATQTAVNTLVSAGGTGQLLANAADASQAAILATHVQAAPLPTVSPKPSTS